MLPQSTTVNRLTITPAQLVSEVSAEKTDTETMEAVAPLMAAYARIYHHMNKQSRDVTLGDFGDALMAMALYKRSGGKLDLHKNTQEISLIGAAYEGWVKRLGGENKGILGLAPSALVLSAATNVQDVATLKKLAPYIAGYARVHAHINHKSGDISIGDFGDALAALGVAKRYSGRMDANTYNGYLTVIEQSLEAFKPIGLAKGNR